MSLRIVDFFGLPVTFRVEARKNTAAVYPDADRGGGGTLSDGDTDRQRRKRL